MKKSKKKTKKSKKESKNPKKSIALENFLKLVEEKDVEKLVKYFGKYGIDPTLARLNLAGFISEEIRDLSRK